MNLEYRVNSVVLSLKYRLKESRAQSKNPGVSPASPHQGAEEVLKGGQGAPLYAGGPHLAERPAGGVGTCDWWLYLWT